jgi:hypothetical protein
MSDVRSAVLSMNVGDNGKQEKYSETKKRKLGGGESLCLACFLHSIRGSKNRREREREREKKQNCLLNDYQYEKKKKKQEKLESERKFVCQYVPLSLLIDALTHCLTMTISDFLSILQLILQLRRDN